LNCSIDVNVICPKCENQESQLYAGAKKIKAVCSRCSTAFEFLYATIRSKKSRGNKQQGTRFFDIRIILRNKDEDFIQFETEGGYDGSYDDFELRSKDLVVFVYLDNKLYIIQNQTINQYKKLEYPSFLDVLGHTFRFW